MRLARFGDRSCKFAGYRADIVQVETPVFERRRTDTHDGQICCGDRVFNICRRPKPPSFSRFGEQRVEFRLHDGRSSLVERGNLCFQDVEADDGVSLFGQTRRGHCPHVTESEYADVHRRSSAKQREAGIPLPLRAFGKSPQCCPETALQFFPREATKMPYTERLVEGDS